MEEKFNNIQVDIKGKYNEILKKMESNLLKIPKTDDNLISIDSLIISHNKEYLKYLKNWINPNPNKQIKAELLYRLSRDGGLISTFHEKCEEMSPTLLITESENRRKLG